MPGKRIVSVALLLAGSAIVVWWGFALSRAKPLGGLDFRALYESTACLIAHHDPYNAATLRDFYVSRGDAQLYPEWAIYTLALINYLPTTFLVVAPFALLPWGAAQATWTVLIAGSFVFAAFLIWRMCEETAPLMASVLIAFLLANSEITLSGGNAAGLVVSLCAIAVWCFLGNQYAWAGVLCLAASLALKPHDAGLVWLFFLLAGVCWRKRAWQTLAVCVALGIVGVAWVSTIAPHWVAELRSVLAVYSAHGGANDPGIAQSPSGAFRKYGMAVSPGMVCSLQSVVAVFHDDPRFYNPITYLVCAPFLIAWGIVSWRSRFTRTRAYLALAAIVPFTLLVTYHRTTDAKLLLLTIPACAYLWMKGGMRAKMGAVLTGLAIFMTGDIPLVVIGQMVGKPDWQSAGLLQRALLIFVYRPVPVILLVVGVFYMWVYVRSASAEDYGDVGEVNAQAR